jgi:tetratricopeptide (TPR) repeat protein
MYLVNIRTYERKYLWKTACLLALVFQFFASAALAQPNLSIELKKPKAYETRELPSEKTGNKKFTAPKRFYNNLVSRFNYYFNANNKMNEILDMAKSRHQDDYTQLLSFYNYSLDETSKGQIDTIIYKTTAGILLHDLRSDWVDKLYLLMGRAYLYRKDFDSASNVFQYINYAFAPKDDGYDLPIGSNASNTNGVFTIATRESKSVWKKVASFPPSRNESFIWQARTYIEQDELTEAASLLELVKADPNFPARLQNDLHEMISYVMYKQQQYETSADYLLLALDNAANKGERSRWEYLAAQMYALANNNNKAKLLFERSIQHAIDPLLEVNARMNIVSLAAGAEGDAIQRNLDELLKMAKRDKYQEYRDIIYYAAAELELKRKNYAAAENHLLNSIKYNSTNPLQRQLSFLLLGDMNYPLKKYSPSYKYYDSITTALLKDEDRGRVNSRKPALKIISGNIDVISREDSLQKLATLTPEERDAFLKKLLRQLRKAQGLKDADAANAGFGNSLVNPNASSDLFVSTGSDFYFLNNTQKARGSVEFKAKWGGRPNVDNWRRQSAASMTVNNTATPTGDKGIIAGPKKETEFTIETLSKDIPITSAQLQNSNDAIIKSLLLNASTFQNQLEDYSSAIEMYEELIRRYPDNAAVEEALYNLAYAYKKAGDVAKADAATAQLKKSFGNGKMVGQLNAAANTQKNASPAQKQYENIYTLYHRGRFEEAKEAKLKADKEFGKNFWTPQLLYIESIYYIKQKQDSTAISRLQDIVSLFGKSALAEKAGTMIDVLKRRSQIENYLTNLKVSRDDETVSRGVDLNATVPVNAAAAAKKDSIAAPTALNNAGKQLVNLSNTNTAPVPEVKKDSGNALIVLPKDIKKPELVNTVTAPPLTESKTYTFNASDTQYVVVVLNNVDPIFVTEGRNAFNRFNQDTYADKRYDVFNRKVNQQYNFILIGPFANAGDAVTYIDRTKAVAKTRIVPWLTADKYSFLMISNHNMALVLDKQDVEGYHTFIQKIFPDKF